MAGLTAAAAPDRPDDDFFSPKFSASRPALLSSAKTGPQRGTRASQLSQPSILDLLTALPLLLSLDQNDCVATLNGTYERASECATQHPMLLGGRTALGSSRAESARRGVEQDAFGDEASTAVFAVLQTRGSPAWQSRRRRLRRAALDAFFRVRVPAPIFTRGGAAGADIDGLHEATIRLLAHTRAVMSDVSPTQAHLVDLFAAKILGSPRDSYKDAAAGHHGGAGWSLVEAATAAVGEDEAQSDRTQTNATLSRHSAAAQRTSQVPRGIMKASTHSSTTHTTSAADQNRVPEHGCAASSTAEQLLYIVLRTSIAANTPRWENEGEIGATAPYASVRTPPLQAAASSNGQSQQHQRSSPTTTASSTGSLTGKKPRTDWLGDVRADGQKEVQQEQLQQRAITGWHRDGAAALFASNEAESIRHAPASAVRGGGGSTAVSSVLPYEPQCWLGPATVALVERSETLRRQQRWTCDRDPVIEATIAGDGGDAYYHVATAAAADNSCRGADVNVSAQYRQRSHWGIASAVAENIEGEADVFAGLIRENALPFVSADARTRHTSAAAGSARCSLAEEHESASPLGLLHWGLEDDGDGRGADHAVCALFSKTPPSEVNASEPEVLSTSTKTAGTERRTRRSGTVAMPPSLPACRTPFASCNALYGPVVYAHVHMALHRCTAGFVDPYELTYCDTQAGLNFIEIRVRPELYSTTQQMPRTHSGLTAMLEWGCRCGTLLLRLHRLCEVAEEASLRASLGSYGRSAMDTLRLLLCLLQRQIWELGDRVGGTHRMSFTELLTAQQHLQNAVEQVEALAAFFTVPSISAAAAAAAASAASAYSPASSARARTKAQPPAWEPIAVLQKSCSSALLVSRLHQLFTTRHANALGQHGNLATSYGELQHDSLKEWMCSFRSGDSLAEGRQGEQRDGRLEAHAELTDNTTTLPCAGADHASRQRRRKELLSRSMDAIGLLLRATLRPLNAMLHRWLTAGELSDPYDEFFVVPSHGQTLSGFTLDLSPQRLPVFVSSAAANDFLHAGVSLRVLRAAATHVALSAQKDVRRLHGMAELTEAAAEDYAEELLDAQTLQGAIEKFIERLVRGAPTVEGVRDMGRFTRHSRTREGGGDRLADALPLPPRVDVLSAYGATNWWRQHYQACTQVLLDAVEEAAGAAAAASVPEMRCVDVQEGAWKEQEEERIVHGTENEEPSVASSGDTHSISLPVEPRNEEEQVEVLVGAHAAAASMQSGPTRAEPHDSGSLVDLTTVLVTANEEAGAKASELSPVAQTTAANTNTITHQGTSAHLTYPLGISLDTSVAKHLHAASSDAQGSEGAEQPYITVFMNSDDEEDRIEAGAHTADSVGGGQQQQQRTRHNDATSLFSSSSSSARSRQLSSSAATTSVLGLRHVAGSKFSTGSTVSSTASSRGTIALYGAITEELRQVSLLEQQTEARAGQSRQALKAEFTTQMVRRRREMRMGDWKVLRLALRLRRVRAMEGIVEELRDVYGIRGAGDAEPEDAHLEASGQHYRGMDNEEATASLSFSSHAPRVVIPLKQLPPLRTSLPVVLYTEDALGDEEQRGRGHSSSHARQPRRTSFATTTTVIELPSHLPATSSVHQQHRLMPMPHPSGILMPPRRTQTRSASGPTLPTVLLSSSLAQKERSSVASDERNALPQGLRTSSPRAESSTDQRSQSTPTATATATANTAVSGSVSTVRHLRDVAVAAGGLKGHAAKTKDSATTAKERDAFTDPLALLCNEEQAGVETVRDQWCRTASSPPARSTRQNEEDEKERESLQRKSLRRDTLGYTHQDSSYVVADINDDEFLWMRTGPKSYARREAEAAALARLAARQAELNSCTVDAPIFLQRLTDAAHAMMTRTEGEKHRDGDVDARPHDQQDQHAGPVGSHHGDIQKAQPDTSDEEANAGGRGTAASATHTQQPSPSDVLPAELSSVWRCDDPLDRLRRRGPQGTPRNAGESDADADADGDEGNGSRTDQLWAWTPAEAHRWYFDGSVAFRHAFTGDALDRALLVDLPLRAEEAEALQGCGGYYRALGQYTSSFLTHKALQLTLLPPYGSLFRLTSQFIDVCLLQRSAVAVRIVDAWITAVDAALESTAEQEEAAMAKAIVAGATNEPAPLASLTNQQQGLDQEATLNTLNQVFQREWASCVQNGETTVTLAWSLLRHTDGPRRVGDDAAKLFAAPPSSRVDVSITQALGLGEEEEDDDLDSHAGRERAPFFGSHQSHDEEADPRARVRPGRTSSPIQAFLAALRLTPVTPWCSGAWLLSERTTSCLGGIFTALLFWKSVERVVLHTWRAGMESGLSSVFFFCTTVRQVLLSTLHEQLWGRLAEVASTYRESLQFEAGVLYTYRALESFTVDHEKFLRECEFYTLCGPPFQRRVGPLLRAMMREVEVAERALRFAQVTTRVARRQYMATFHSMVSSSSSSSDDDGENTNGVNSKSGPASVQQRRRRLAASTPTPAASATHTHVFTPSRWCRRSTHDASAKTSRGGMKPQPAQEQQHPSRTDGDAETAKPGTSTHEIPTPRPKRAKKKSHSANCSVTTQSSAGPSRTKHPGERSASALSTCTCTTTTTTTTTTTNTNAIASAKRTRVRGEAKEDDEEAEDEEGSTLGSSSGSSVSDSINDSREGAIEDDHHSTDPTPPASAKRRRKRRCRPLQTKVPKGPPRRSIMESATMNTTPFYATVLAARHQQQPTPQPPPQQQQHAQKRSRSGGVGRGRGGHRDLPPRLTPAERRDRRAKLRVIAERKIAEETDHQRRRMRDVVARRLRRFVSLTQALRGALSEVMAQEDVSAQAAMQAADMHVNTTTAAAAREVHDAQRQQMSRFTYLSSIIRQLDALLEVMERQV